MRKAEVDVFLELSCFFDDPADFGNLISGFSAYLPTLLLELSAYLKNYSEKIYHLNRF